MRCAVLLVPLVAIALACRSSAGYDRDNDALMQTAPQYPGAVLVAQTRIADSLVNDRALVHVFATPDSLQDVIAFFDQQLVASGWQQQSGGKDQIERAYVKTGSRVEING